ncbi:GAF domain-containing protein [Myxacorys almedinensis A]|uniref:GAF domain-containing protein n=2 Tax=Myxacorys TaxID=2056239 RepID=A0A8J7Z3W3_9CYAN|nr:GAF domain-containing protein [Myxacorys almedinensis A]
MTPPKSEMARPALIAANRDLPHPAPTVFQRIKRLGFRTKATALAIAIATLPVLGIGAIAYRLANRSITLQIRETKENSALTLSQKLASFMAERHGDIQVLSSLPILTNPILRDATSSTEKEAVLERFVEAYKAYDNITVFDLKGNATLQSDQQTILSQSEQAYFKAAIDANKVLISRPVRANLTGPYVIYLTAPIRESGGGRKLGIVRAVLPVRSLTEQLRDYTRSNSEFSVLDGSNQIFLSSQEALIGQPASSVYSQFSAIQSRRSISTRVLERRIQTEQEQLFASYVPWAGNDTVPDLNWGTVLGTPTEVAFAPQRQLLLTFVLGTGAVMVLTGLLAAWLANRATRPILAATTAVQDLGSGKLDTRLTVRGSDELASLGNHINGMADQLQVLLHNQAQSVQRSQFLSEVITKIRRSLTVDDIFQTTVNDVRGFLKTERVVIYTFNPDYLSGTIVAESIAPGWIRGLGKIIDDPLEPGAIDRYKDGRVWSVEDVQSAKLSHCHCQILERLQVQANIVAPILQNKEVVGLLCAHQCSSTRHWTPEELELFGQLAAQIGYAIDEAHLLSQAEAARHVAETLSDEQRQQKEDLQMQLIQLLGEVEGAVSGDLTVRADVTADEIGTVADFFNSIVESLRQIVTQVKEAAGQVNASLGDDEQSVRQLSETAMQQAEETNRTLNSVQQMVQSIQAVSSSARQAAAVAKSAFSTAEAGGVAMELTVQNILGLRETIGETAKKVKRLGESSQQISKVVSLINQIAVQTNLLAINAGIEAARAGEDSQGFAVVAEEVGELAARSAAATRDIEQIVATIQRETSEVVEAMEQGTTQVVEGTRLVDNAKFSLEQILTVSQEIDQLVGSISNATVSQVETSQAVTTLMQDIVRSAGRTSESTMQVSQSIRQTVEIARELQESVGTFKVS